MFKKLKVKLTLLNLAVAGIILLGISAVSYILISDNIQNQSVQLLQAVTNNFAAQQINSGQTAATYSVATDGGIFPYIFITIDAEKKVMVGASVQVTSVTKQGDTNIGFTEALDKQQIQEAVQIILNEKNNIDNAAKNLPETDQSKAVVVISHKNDIINLTANKSYRFNTLYSDGYIFAIMQDMQSEKELLTNVAFTLGICVLAGLVLMTMGGFFLAERSIRPIRASWQKQRDFVADASHELRTPLAAIIGNIDVVMDDPHALVQDKQLYCQGISEEARRMSLLVDGLLMLARADSEAIVLQKSNVDLSELTQDAVALMQPVAAKKKISIHLNIIQSPSVEGDALRLKQVLLQLIDNAIKYTESGGRVEIGVCGANDKAIIRIADNGIGIPKAHFEKIFERFYRVDSSRERETGGHGLGLSIAKHIIEQHDGSITVVSEEGKGSMFTITLPALKTLTDN